MNVKSKSLLAVGSFLGLYAILVFMNGLTIARLPITEKLLLRGWRIEKTVSEYILETKGWARSEYEMSFIGQSGEHFIVGVRRHGPPTSWLGWSEMTPMLILSENRQSVSKVRVPERRWRDVRSGREEEISLP